MTNIVKIKNSNIPGREPTELLEGELAINFHDGKLFYHDDVSNTVNHFISDPKFISNIILDYKRSTVSDLLSETIGVYSKVRPPYIHDYQYYAQVTYNTETDTSSNVMNVKEVSKISTGSYRIYMNSPFPDSTYEVDLKIPSFNDFGESLNYARVSSQDANWIQIETGRTNISDINIVDAYDVTSFTIKLFS